MEEFGSKGNTDDDIIAVSIQYRVKELCPVLNSPEQEKQCHTGEILSKGHQDNKGKGISPLRKG